MSAFAVFYMQSPSFLAYQRDMHNHRGSSNAQRLFGVERIPSDSQIRNLLDGVSPSHVQAEFKWIHQELERAGRMDAMRDVANTLLIALDGVTYYESTQIHCAQCLTRRDSTGVTHYYHSAITPVIVKPDCAQVLPLAPEFIVPQDGQEKQGCERNAAQRWLAQHRGDDAPYSVTYLGDDLYANQPLCKAVWHDYQQYFVCVAKPDSHPTLYDWLTQLDKAGAIEHLSQRRWNGRFAEIGHYRWVSDVPLRAGEDALRVTWFELTMTRADTGEQLFHNAWVTNHQVDSATVAAFAKAGRTRWKVENENNNVLKNNGYHLEHNFGHGKRYLSTILFSLNLLAFLTHTAQQLVCEPYRLLRQALCVRRTFFDDLRALTRYVLFDSWDHLFRFMFEGLEIAIPPGLFISD